MSPKNEPHANFFVSSTIRYRDYGYIYEVDFPNQVVNKTAIFNDNPAAKHGGPHGITTCGTKIIAGTYSDIRIFDGQLNLLNSFTHPFLTDIHGISFNDGKIWVTCTNNEGVFAFDFQGDLLEEHFLTENTELMSLIKKPAREINKSNDFRQFRRSYEQHPFHVNHVHETERGLEVSLHKLGVIWDLRENRKLAKIPSECIHDGQSVDGGFFLNDSLAHESVFLNIEEEEENRVNIKFQNHASALYRLFRATQEFSHRALHKLHLWFPNLFSPRKCWQDWIRGFLPDCKSQYCGFVGGSPASIYKIDMANGQVKNSLVLSSNLCEAVFDLAQFAD